MKVFFDVDGVLIDGWHSDPARRIPWDAQIERDLGVDRQAFQDLFFGKAGDRSRSPMSECVVGRRDIKDALAKVLPDVGYRGSVDDFIRYWFRKDSNLNSEVLALVQKLRSQGVATYMATGQEHHRAAYLWSDLGLSHAFDAIFYSAMLGVPKRDPAFFDAINRELGISQEERPIFFDDQSEIVEVAATMGWDAIRYTSVSDIRSHARLRHLL